MESGSQFWTRAPAAWPGGRLSGSGSDAEFRSSPPGGIWNARRRAWPGRGSKRASSICGIRAACGRRLKFAAIFWTLLRSRSASVDWNDWTRKRNAAGRVSQRSRIHRRAPRGRYRCCNRLAAGLDRRQSIAASSAAAADPAALQTPFDSIDAEAALDPPNGAALI